MKMASITPVFCLSCNDSIENHSKEQAISGALKICKGILN
jgi:hypothetical protein